MRTLPIVIVLDKDNNILLLHRIDRNTREPVKWWIESWETPEQAIIRELYEETGIKKPTSFLQKIEEYTIWSLHKIIYMMQLEDIKPTISINHIIEWWEDHDDYAWFSLPELSNLNIDYKEEFLTYISKISTLNS